MYDRYLTKDRPFTRTAAIDCPVRKAELCCSRVRRPRGLHLRRHPDQLTTEVHNAGEVWAQALWDLREPSATA